MRPLRLLLLAGLVLPVQASWAQEASNPSSETKAEKKREIVESLDSFLAEATREGVLVPPGGGEPAPASRPAAKPSGKVESEAHPARDDSKPAPVAATRSCGRGDALDFSALSDIIRYADLEQFQEAARNRDPASSPDAVQTLVKAYIALGLYSEALVLVDKAHDPDFAVYRSMIVFLRDGAAGANDFRDILEQCGMTGLWSGVARLSGGDASGIEQISREMTQFRELPYHLRVRVAFLTVPELARQGETMQANRLMATFRSEEIDGSARLQFLVTLLALEGGEAGASVEMRSYLNTPGLSELALEALLRAEAPISEAEKAVILSDEVKRLKGGRTSGEGTSAGFDFVVSELIAERRYSQIIGLVEEAETRNEDEREQIRLAMARQLREDLEGGDPMRSMGVMSVLADNPIGLKSEATKDLYEEASLRAFRMGLPSFGAGFAAGFELSEEVSEAQAVAAYRDGDAATVWAVADRFPHSETLALLAALSAIREDRAERLRTYEARLAPTPIVLTALLGKDAASGRWIVDERFYAAAEAIPAGERSPEIALALELRQPPRTPRPAPPIGEIGIALDGTRAAMARVTGGRAIGGGSP